MPIKLPIIVHRFYWLNSITRKVGVLPGAPLPALPAGSPEVTPCDHSPFCPPGAALTTVLAPLFLALKQRLAGGTRRGSPVVGSPLPLSSCPAFPSALLSVIQVMTSMA